MIETPAPQFWLDDNTTVHTATGVGKVGGSARVFDTGSDVLPYHGVVLIQISELDRTSGNETYRLVVEISKTPDFSSQVVQRSVWNAQIINPQDALLFSNVFNDSVYRYVRFVPEITGTTPAFRALVFIQSLTEVNTLTFAEQITSQVLIAGNLSNAISNLRSWMAGTVDGGPNQDGIYPVSDGLGNTVHFPCLAKLVDMASNGGGLSQPEVDALPAHTGAAPLMIPGTAQTGSGRELRKVSLPEYIGEIRKDLSLLTDAAAAEHIPAFLFGSGLEVKISLAELRQNFGGIIDVTKPPYNVVFDFRKGHGVAGMNSGSNVVVLNENMFESPRDLGKLLAIGNVHTDGALKGYIGEVLNAKQVRIFTDQTYTAPANANITTGNQDVMWGTDNTEGVQRALDDAEPNTIHELGKIVFISGAAMIRSVRWGAVSVVGFAAETCGFAQIPEKNAQAPMYADKVTGKYVMLKPHHYTHINLGFWGMRYCQYYSSFRTCFHIYGGLAHQFRESAPYSRLQNIDVWQAQWNGFDMSGAFGGKVEGIRAMFCAQNGIRSGLWDVNGHSWHAEGNGYTGIVDLMAGANLTTLKCSFNGINAALDGKVYEQGANYLCLGTGGTITNLRVQESWGPNIVLSSYDPLGAMNNACRRNKFNQVTIDDTGNVGTAKGQRTAQLPPVRPMVLLRGASVRENIIRFTTGEYGISPANYATHAYYDMEGPRDNKIQIDTLGITSWYGTESGEFAPALVGSNSDTKPSVRNKIVMNDDAVLPELSTLQPLAKAFQIGAAAGTKITDLKRRSPNSSLSITSPLDGRFVVTGNELDGWALYVGSSPSFAGQEPVQIVESHASAFNSPNPTTIPITCMDIAPYILLDTMENTPGTNFIRHTGEKGSYWTAHPVDSEARLRRAEISASNTLFMPVSGFPVFLSSAVPATANYWIEAIFDVKTVVAGDAFGVCGRVSANALTFYMTRYNGGSVQLYRVVNGTFTVIGTAAVTPWSAGQTPSLRLTMNGQNISAQWNGVTVVSGNDSAITDKGTIAVRLLCATPQTTTTGSQISHLSAGAI